MGFLSLLGGGIAPGLVRPGTPGTQAQEHAPRAAAVRRVAAGHGALEVLWMQLNLKGAV